MDFYGRLSQELAAGERLALLTVVYTEGSVPRKAGAKMMVNAQGQMLGTIGGGCPEVEASTEAMQVARTGGGRLCVMEMRHQREDLEANPEEEVLICGGIQKVLVESLSSAEPQGQLMQRVLERLDKGEAPQALVTLWRETSAERPLPQRVGTMADVEVARVAVWASGQIEGELPGADLTIAETQAAVRALAAKVAASCKPQFSHVEACGQTWSVYGEPLERAKRLVIAGAGHVAVPLCQVAALCGYAVTVVDDREEFATPERFPAARAVVTADFGEFFSALDIDAGMSIVIITRGHRCDEQCLHAIAGRRSRYLGMIGSRHRTAIVRERLQESGYDQAWIDSLNAPIGLDLGAETPEEIAVAIVAQMIDQAPERTKKGY